MSGTLIIWPHYEVSKLEGMGDIRHVFNDNTDYTLNWLFLSTSGIHGSYVTLDELAKEQDSEYRSITAVIVQPRLVVIHYGDITIEPEDFPYLRNVVSQTIKGIRESQLGNLPIEEQ